MSWSREPKAADRQARNNIHCNYIRRYDFKRQTGESNKYKQMESIRREEKIEIPFQSRKEHMICAPTHPLCFVLLSASIIIPSSHEIILIKPVLIAPPLPIQRIAPQLLPPSLSLLLLPPPFPLDPFLLPLALLPFLPLRAPPLLQPRLLLAHQLLRAPHRLRLLEPVDDRVRAGRDQDPAREAGVVEGDLARRHVARLFQVGPGGVDDGYVVFLVACGTT